MKRTKEEYLGLLKETVDFYSEDTDRRALEVVENYGYSVCRYLTKDGNKCAIGRCMNPKKYEPSIEGETAYGIGNIDDLILPKYQGYDTDFWGKLQDLHDTDCNWEHNSLSEIGEQKVASLKEWVNHNI